MCFTPQVSLSTAIIEFVTGTSIWIFFRKSLVNRFCIVFLYLLGFYQFTEFMLCTSDDPVLWVKLGYITYTFLPAMGLHFAIRITDRKYKGWLLYVLPVTFSLIAIFTKDFVITSVCSTVFVIVRLCKSLIHSLLYTIYYFGFIALVCFFLWNRFRKEKNLIRRKLYILVLLTVLASLISALILIVIFPSLGIMFPSIYCQFALLFAIAALVGAYLDSRLQTKK